MRSARRSAPRRSPASIRVEAPGRGALVLAALVAPVLAAPTLAASVSDTPEFGEALALWAILLLLPDQLQQVVVWVVFLVVILLLAPRALAEFLAHLVMGWEELRDGPAGARWRSQFVPGTSVYRWCRARTALDPRGKVMNRGELWNAVSERPVPAGAIVEVVAVEGLILRVRPADSVPADSVPPDATPASDHPEPEPLAPDSEDTVTADTRPGSKPTC